MIDPNRVIPPLRVVSVAGYEYAKTRPRVVCADGYSVSIQAGEHLYSRPRSNHGPWEAFELGYPSAADDLLSRYAEDSSRPTDTVYGYVPADVVGRLIEKHGGIVRFDDASEPSASA